MAKYTWSGQGTSSAWGDAGNWAPAGVPGAADLTAFTSANATVTGDEVVGAITALSPTDLGFTGAVTTMGLAGRASSFQADGGARLVFEAGSSLSVADELAVGIGAGDTSLTFSGNALHSQSAVVGLRAGSQGEIAIDDGGAWENAGALIIGRSGTGGLSLGGGAHLYAGVFGRHAHGGNIVLGQSAGANGALDVSGGGGVLAEGTLSVGGVLGAAAHGTGQLSVGPDSSVDALGGVTIAQGSTASLAGGSLSGGIVVIAAGATLLGSGFVDGTDGLVNDGQILASGQLFLTSGITGTGTLEIGSGATLGLDTAAVTQSALRFLGPGATLQLQEPLPTLTALIEGFRPGDFIVAQAATSVSFDTTDDKLTLYNGQTEEGVLSFTGNYTGDTFQISPTGSITVTHHP